MIATSHAPLRLPPFLRKQLGEQRVRGHVHQLLRQNRLSTVCEEAKCPNIGECFSQNTATFMILGDRCSRRCHFCAVKTGRGRPLDPNEPAMLVDAARQLKLEHIVLTSVDRDDLPDTGAHHFAGCIRTLKQEIPDITVELLTPDFKGVSKHIDTVLDAGPHIWGHNIETVERLYRTVRPQSRWEVTSSVLRYVAETKQVSVKSGMMVGLGETDEEVDETLHYVRELGVNMLTIGQYLRPSLKNWPVARYVNEQSYIRWKAFGKSLGFSSVDAGPFVRSSYHAKESYADAGESLRMPMLELLSGS